MRRWGLFEWGLLGFLAGAELAWIGFLLFCLPELVAWAVGPP